MHHTAACTNVIDLELTILVKIIELIYNYLHVDIHSRGDLWAGYLWILYIGWAHKIGYCDFTLILISNCLISELLYLGSYISPKV
jgi:hypothetical protein